MSAPKETTKETKEETTKKTTKEEETLGLIYKVTAPNGRGYVGETIRTLSVRWNAHCQAASYCINLKRAILKYGRENMTLEVLEADVPFERLREREAHYIEQHGTLAPHGYNLRVGGGEKHRFSDETLEKMHIAAWKRMVKYFCVRCGVRVCNGCVRCGRCALSPDDNQGRKNTSRKYGVRCIDCGVEVWSGSTRCNKCNRAANHTKYVLDQHRPSAEQIIADVEAMGYSKTGAKYHVSDNAVRKWLKRYENNDEEAAVLIKAFRERWKNMARSDKCHMMKRPVPEGLTYAALKERVDAVGYDKTAAEYQSVIKVVKRWLSELA